MQTSSGSAVNFKKFIYILLATVLMVIVSFLIHVIIEIPIIYIVVADFKKYSFGLSWNQILAIHAIFTLILFLAGIIAGLIFGFRWWKYIYVDKKYQGGYLRRLFKK